MKCHFRGRQNYVLMKDYKKTFYFKIVCTNQLCKIKRGAFISQVNLDFLLSLNMDSGKSLTVICLSQQWLYLHAHLLNEHNTQHTQSHSLCVVIKGLRYFYACGRYFLHIQFKITNWHAEHSHMSRFLKNKHTHWYTQICDPSPQPTAVSADLGSQRLCYLKTQRFCR